jgi:hypothetical protein
MTNTMIVVIVVSRRVGQVTFAVSERTSCRNLNGLKAIVDMIRSVRAIFRESQGIRTALQRPTLVSKDEPPSGLDCSGEIKAAPDIRQNGPAAGGGYVLRAGPKVKVRGTRPRTQPCRQAPAIQLVRSNAGSRTANPVIGVRERESWTPYRLDVPVVGARAVGNTHSRSVRKTPSPMPNAELQRSIT